MSDIEEKELSFTESYRSQILNPEEEEDDSVRNIIIIVLLVIMVSTLSILGYKYIVLDEEPKIEKVQSKAIENDSEEMFLSPPESEKYDMTIPNADELIEELNGTSSKISNKSEDTNGSTSEETNSIYIEQLAELSKEIDKEK